MYEALTEFNSIVISGPQRSGTRICAQIVAADTGKEYIDEKMIANHDFRLLKYYLAQGNVVVQCPGLCHLLHMIDAKDSLAIIVRRPVDEIIRSERRIGWLETARFAELYKYGHADGIISKIKYEFWDGYQQRILGDRGREIGYHSLEAHPLFVADRSGFAWDQTK